jgi:hypothetical protein
LEYAAWASNFLSTKPTSVNLPIQNNSGVKIVGNKQKIILENDNTSGQVAVYLTNGIFVSSCKLLPDEKKIISLPMGSYIVRIQKNNCTNTHKIIL